MKQVFLGIDISKQSFHAALLNDGREKIFYKEFSNKQAGFEELVIWIKKQGNVCPEDLHACMEATGIYGEQLATFLYHAGSLVSVVNGAQIKGFGQSELARTKTDKADAHLIARFCQAIRPKAWQPQPENIRKLNALVKRLEDEQAIWLQEKNRRESVEESVSSILEESINFHEQQIEKIEEKIKIFIEGDPELRHKKELLRTIPGVSERTLSRILCFMSDASKFEKARQVSAFLGLNPKARQSGTSVRYKGHISKTGNCLLRKWFYMPAMAAMQHNPTIKPFCDRLKSKGKPGKVVVVAAMKKLIHISYGVLKNDSPYQADWKLEKRRIMLTV